MIFFYVRPTKLRPKADQLAVLSGEPDEWYIDEKPTRGEPDWFWWEKLSHLRSSSFSKRRTSLS